MWPRCRSHFHRRQPVGLGTVPREAGGSSPRALKASGEDERHGLVYGDRPRCRLGPDAAPGFHWWLMLRRKPNFPLCLESASCPGRKSFPVVDG